ncbi:MAG: tetraacyldisaccharide 4'-kinase [Candidatus Binatia bacterium]
MTSPQQVIYTIWRRQGFLGKLGWFALAPVSCGFSLIVRGRNQLYDRRWFTSTQHPSLKIISVGNLTVGGTGKTPMVLWLALALSARGHKVGILTKGYRGSNTEVTAVGTHGRPIATPDEVGDEAVMLARLFPGVVIAGRDRVAGAKFARDQFGLDIIILDDGFQHRRLNRQIDLLLFNGQRALDNRWLLPAGPFREPLSAAQRADIILVTKGNRSGNATTLQYSGEAPGNNKPIYYGDMRPLALVSSEQREWREWPLSELSGKRILALTGIADPTSFYHSLQEWGVETAEIIEFPDHHRYSQTDWHTISAVGRKVDLIVTTEKDLVKLERFPFATRKLVALRVRLEIGQEERLLTDIERQLMKVE